ncbi:hypothetical protein PYW07_016794 [Mythimna separata]|uniref:Uncharacterized protein n=1 Tax=Mythimna separata TaxID=271217 RepID=A0AAD8DT91_MYTSE|nr:hypothetical protein PYW07_016794 [Mythimna separata]
MDKWIEAPSPNYETNKDKLYPYSEMPFQKEYKLVKIPISVKNLIEHVSYFGFGRRIINNKTIGFADCYNVNYEYAIVYDGLDEGKKIPNRIPVIEESQFRFSTSNYIKDNSVLTVTVETYMRIVCTELAQDIARVVNSERGKVVLYGATDREVNLISDELKLKQLIYCPIYLLPDNLQLTYYEKNYRAFLSANELKRELYRKVNGADFEAAAILTGCLNNAYCGGALSEVVSKLLQNNVRHVMTYAYKLWNTCDKHVVREHFPPVFQHLFDGGCIAIINNQNDQATVIEQKTTKARGDRRNKLGWKISPILDDNKVLFRLYNIATEKYLQHASAAKDSEELRDKFCFEPLLTISGQVAFKIFYFDDDKPLQLPVDADCLQLQDVAVAGQDRVGSAQDGRSTWILTTADQVEEKSVEKDNPILSDEEEFANLYNYD